LLQRCRSTPSPHHLSFARNLPPSRLFTYAFTPTPESQIFPPFTSACHIFHTSFHRSHSLHCLRLTLYAHPCQATQSSSVAQLPTPHTRFQLFITLPEESFSPRTIPPPQWYNLLLQPCSCHQQTIPFSSLSSPSPPAYGPANQRCVSVPAPCHAYLSRMLPSRLPTKHPFPASYPVFVFWFSLRSCDKHLPITKLLHSFNATVVEIFFLPHFTPRSVILNRCSN